MHEYRNKAIEIHNRWLSQPLTDQEKKQLRKTLDNDFQKIWSDRLPRSTTRDYVSIMKKLNSKVYFSESVYQYLDPVMEQIMRNPNNCEFYYEFQSLYYGIHAYPCFSLLLGLLFSISSFHSSVGQVYKVHLQWDA